MSHGGKWVIMRDISFSHPERVVPNIFCSFFYFFYHFILTVNSVCNMQLLSSLGFMERMIVLAAYIHANLISISVQSLARVVSNVLHDQPLNRSHSTSTYLYNTLVPGARNVTHSLTHWWHTTFYMFWFLKLLKLFDNILKSCFVRWSNLCESFEKLSCISNWCHFP